MDLESEGIANNFDNEENNDNEIWQRDDDDERGAFYFCQNFMGDK